MSDLIDRATIPGVEYRVLGPLSARVQGEPRKLGGRRQQMVLAVLLSSPNEVTSQDKLIESVWAGLEPESAKQTLHSYVSNLRKELGGGIDREGTGYVVHIDEGGLDSTRFEALVGRARGASVTSPAAALGFASEALALWHGPAFGDLGGEPALTAEAMRLEELRLATLEIRVEADIAVGNHPAVIQELEALTAEHPFRERLWGFLMLSLYRAGRQADALRSYQELRRILGEELGIDPAAELQGLEEQILTQDPALDYAAPTSSPVDRAARGYELREQIRETPFGVLLRGFQGSVGREVAVLKLDEAIANDPSFIRRFETEMRSASELEHPHLVSIYDFWRDPEGAYLVTALPRGGVLREVSADQPWNLSSVLRIVDQVSSALSYLHRNGFVHGPLGTESILLDDDSNAYLSDVGLSSLFPGPDHAQSPADDVAALAALAMSLLTGSDAGSGTRLSELRPDLADLDDLFSRALHEDPASRFQKPEELRRALRQATGADVVPSGQEVPSGTRRNPYKGLRAFKESEAVDFHGRDALVEELVEAVASSRLIAVVGPSGSGKSSLVRAGLLPALRSGAIEGSTRWLVAEMFPGTHPFEELEAALIRVATERPSGLFDELTADRRGLARAAKRIIGNDEDQLVIVVDQFEELFSLVTSETSRRLFLESLTAVATDERSRIRVILTLRADFFDQPLQYPEFAEAMNSGLVPISPPTEEGLTRAIAQPARGVGVDLQPGLVTRIIGDVQDEPGGLPLMQYALTELFNKRVNNTMTMAAYEQSGGVAGALANRADEIYGDLSDEGRVAVRNLFLRLVNVDELADDTRRRVRQTELKGLSINQVILDDVIQQFGAFRLLSFDRDAATRTPTVEVAHEALIREWDRLRTWIDDRREDLLIHRRMQVTARDWEDSEKDPSYLLRGSRLEQALIWQGRTDIAITDDEMTFIEASIEQEKRDLAEHQALEDKAARRRKAVIGVLVGGLIVAGVLGAIALDRAGDAELAAADARARELAVLAADTTDDDPERGMLLAIESINISRGAGLEPLPEALGALQRATQKNRVEARFPQADYSVSVSSDGTMIATDTKDAASMDVSLVDVSTGDVVKLFEGPRLSILEGEIPEIHLAFSPNAKHLAIGRRSRETGCIDPDPGDNDPWCGLGGLEVWDLQTGEVTVLIDPLEGYAAPLKFSNDGGYLAAISNDGLLVWDSELHRTEGFANGGLWVGGAIDVDFVGDSSQVSVPLVDEQRIVFIDADSGSESGSLITPELAPEFAAIDPSGTKFVIGDFVQARVQLFDTESGDVSDVGSTSVQAIRWHPDGGTFAVTGNGAVIEVFDGTTGEHLLSLDGHKSSVYQFEFSSDGEHLFSASPDQGVIMWSITADGPNTNGAIALEGDRVRLLDTEPGGTKGVSILTDGLIIFDIDSGGTIFQADLDSPIANETLEYVGGSEPVEDDLLRTHGIWNTQGERIATYDRCTVPKAISPSGELVVVAGQLGEDGCRPDGTRVVAIQSGEVVVDLSEIEFVNAARFSPSGTYDGHLFLALAHGATFGRADVFSIPDGTMLGSFNRDLLGNALLDVRFSPDGRVIGLGMNSSLVAAASMERLVEGASESESLLINQIGHDGNAPRPALTRSGIMATTAFDQWIRLWDLSTRTKMVEFQTGPVPKVPFIAFTADEEYLLYADQGTVVRSYPLNIEVLLARADAVLTRTLTDDECTQYLHTDGCVD